MDFKAKLMRLPCARAQSFELVFRWMCPLLHDGLAPGAGVQLDDGRMNVSGRLNLTLIRLDEERDANAGLRQKRYLRRELVFRPRHLKPAFGCPLRALFGDETGGMRLRRERDFE